MRALTAEQISCNVGIPSRHHYFQIFATMSRIKILSLNTNGIANTIKRRVIFGNFRSQKAKFYLLQETHSTPESGFLWASEWGGRIFHSHGASNSRGVAIMLDRDVDYKMGSVVRDTEGRFVGRPY